MSAKPSLTLRRRLDAPPAKVYDAWTDPAKMMRWFGPERAETLRAETDPRVGVRFRVIMRTADGDEHDVSGVYREVVPNQKLVFTWAWRSTPERESLVTIAFRSDGDGTVLTLTHEQSWTTPPATPIAKAGRGSRQTRSVLRLTTARLEQRGSDGG